MSNDTGRCILNKSIKSKMKLNLSRVTLDALERGFKELNLFINLDGDFSISEAISLVNKLKQWPDSWFPKGKWATIHVIQGQFNIGEKCSM